MADPALPSQSAALALDPQPTLPKTESSEADPLESTLSRWALASFGFGLLAWLLLFYEDPTVMRLIYALGGERTLFAITTLLALVGIVSGHKALSDLHAAQGARHGRKLALLGLSISYLFLPFCALIIYILISMNAL